MGQVQLIYAILGGVVKRDLTTERRLLLIQGANKAPFEW